MCHHCFGCSPRCSNRHDGRPARKPIQKCSACRRANPPDLAKCKHCGADLLKERQKPI